MKNTMNYNLKKPEFEDYVDVTDLNDNMDIVDEELHKLKANQGNLSLLKTTDKSNFVNSLNELFTNADNGKKAIATVVGSPATSNDTFDQLKTHIQNAKNKGAANLTLKGTPASGTESLDSLMSKIANISTKMVLPLSTLESISNIFATSLQTGEVTNNEYYFTSRVSNFDTTTTHYPTTIKLYKYDKNGNLIMNRTESSLTNLNNVVLTSYGYVLSYGELGYQKLVIKDINGNIISTINNKFQNEGTMFIHKDRLIWCRGNFVDEYDFNFNRLKTHSINSYFTSFLYTNGKIYEYTNKRFRVFDIDSGVMEKDYKINIFEPFIWASVI
ncbi:hypothetical protein [Bacillus sp. NPDC094106]|uniref:hypothetical protein n=1 Tax=Bacillus sp. NPDC094106 TaxID=3363949 RepID=UPI003811B877